MSTRDNITHGPAYLAVAPLGTALPATEEDALAIVGGTFEGFTTVGQTSTPVTLTTTLERSDTRSTQSARPIAGHVNGAIEEVNTTLLEITDEQIAQALEGTASVAAGVTTIDPVADPSQATYYAIAVVGPHGRTGTSLWVGECVARAEDSAELAYTREEDTTLAVTWRVYEGDELPSGSRWRLFGTGGGTDLGSGS